ncbi:hypothetical protein PXQ59_002183 [Vibrio parahaemolyticus]|nr:hypothetical protein [Vibrio parahaemolyticus]
MDINRINRINQYEIVRLPITAEQCVEHFAFIAKASGEKQAVIMKSFRTITRLNRKRLIILRNEPEKLQNFDKAFDKVLKKESEYLTDMIGVDLTKKYTTTEMWNSLIDSFGEANVVHNLYAKELLAVWSVICKNHEYVSAVKKELKQIGVNTKTVQNLLKSIAQADKNKRTDSYLISRKRLEIELANAYKGMFLSDKQDQLQSVPIKQVVDQFIKSHRFVDVADGFNQNMPNSNYIPTVMFLKLLFSQVINKVFKDNMLKQKRTA